MKGFRHIISLLWVLAFVFASVAVYAYVDEDGHWPVESTLHWSSIYGAVEGISLEEGDSVGVFDSEGNCYGVGIFDGEHFYLSAFMEEEADPNIPGDFTIPGFKDGDEVVFKVYKESIGTEYALKPSSGTSYTYEYKGEYPPVKVNLSYDTGGGTGDGGTGTGDGGTITGGTTETAGTTGAEGVPSQASTTGPSAFLKEEAEAEPGKAAAPSYESISETPYKDEAALSLAKSVSKDYAREDISQDYEGKRDIISKPLTKDTFREDYIARHGSRHLKSPAAEEIIYEKPKFPKAKGIPIFVKLFLVFAIPFTFIFVLLIKLYK